MSNDELLEKLIKSIDKHPPNLRKANNGKSNEISRKALYIKQRGLCVYCNNYVSFEVWTIDHKIPRCRNGTNDRANLVGCCYECNILKGWLTDVEFKLIPREDLDYFKGKIDREIKIVNIQSDIEQAVEHLKASLQNQNRVMIQYFYRRVIHETRRLERLVGPESSPPIEEIIRSARIVLRLEIQ